MVEKVFENPGFYFQWHFLEECNLKCKHCYQKGNVYKKADKQIIDQTLCQIEKALNAWDITGRVSITGGEPLLDLKNLFYILENLSKIEKITHLGILTNGTLLTPEITNKLCHFSKLKEIQISLDGASSQVHDRIRGIGNFEKAINGIKLISKTDINSSVMFTVNKLNYTDIINVIELAENLNVDAITLERYTPTHEKDPLALNKELTQHIFEKIYEYKCEVKKNNRKIKIRTSRPLWNIVSDDCGGVCPVGFSCLTLMHDGKILPCRRLPIELGTIQNDGMFKVWYTSEVLNNLRKRDKIKKCSDCKRNHVCGGCRAAAFAVSHDYMGQDPLCWEQI